MKKNTAINIQELKNAMHFAIDANEHAYESIDRKVFVEEIYQKRGIRIFEEQLMRELITSRQLVCLAGGRGTGKSSTLHWCQYKINNSDTGERHVHMTIIDLKRLIEGNEFRKNVDDNPILSFRTCLRKRFITKYFRKDRKDLYAWLLAGAPDDSDHFPQSLTSELVDDVHDLMDILGYDPATQRTERVKIIHDFFKQDKKTYKHFEEKIEHHVRPAHIIQAAKNLREWKRLVFAYDNIDQIPHKYQKVFFEAVHTIHSSIGGACTTAIAIRIENIQEYWNSRGGGHEGISVKLSNHREYPGLLIPNYTEEHCRGILEKRFTLAEKLSEEDSSIADLYDLQDNEFNIDRQFHVSVVESLLESKVNSLGNNSIRNVNLIYCKFLDYLSILDEDVFDIRSLETLFYLWLVTAGKQFGILIYDVVDVNCTDISKNYRLPDSSLPHLLLTLLLNISKGEGVDDGVEFDELYSHLSIFGYEKSKVVSLIKQLCSNSTESTGVIRFSKNYGGEVNYEAGKYCLTPCGKILVEEIYSKIGYVLGRYYLIGKNHESAIKTHKRYLNFSKLDKIGAVLDYLVMMSTKHLALLEQVKLIFADSHAEDWLSHYRKYYGVNGELQIERIANSARLFYSYRYSFSDEIRNPFVIFLNRYNRAVMAIDKEEPGNWRELCDSLGDCKQYVGKEEDTAK